MIANCPKCNKEYVFLSDVIYTEFRCSLCGVCLCVVVDEIRLVQMED